MSELKKFESNSPIEITLSLNLAKHGFKFLRTEDLGEMDGICDECKHPIRYENYFLDKQDDIEYIFGSECMFKIYIFSQWRDQITEDQIEDRDLQRAGKWLWIISRDKYSDKIDRIPEPKDFDYDFKKLADELKKIVFKVRSDIKKEIKAEEKRKERIEIIKKERNKIVEWLNNLEINWKSCNEWEKSFLASIYTKRIRNGYDLSAKQEKTLLKISSRRSQPEQKNIDDDFVENENKTNETVDLLRELSSKKQYLNDWEIEFLDSALKQSLTNTLTTKQWDKINQIVDKITEEEKKSEYINRLVDTWILEKNLNVEFNKEGIITDVEKETDKAILCSVLNPETKKTFFGIWIPKSTILE